MLQENQNFLPQIIQNDNRYLRKPRQYKTRKVNYKHHKLLKKFNSGDSRDYVEPLVGGRIIWELNDKFALNFRGDIGGFGIGSGSDLTYQLIPGCSYKLSENTTFDFSYRYVNLDYSNGSGRDKLAIDLEAYGPVFGLSIFF